jgi:hypothetical protein
MAREQPAQLNRQLAGVAARAAAELYADAPGIERLEGGEVARRRRGDVEQRERTRAAAVRVLADEHGAAMVLDVGLGFLRDADVHARDRTGVSSSITDAYPGLGSVRP